MPCPRQENEVTPRQSGRKFSHATFNTGRKSCRCCRAGPRQGACYQRGYRDFALQDGTSFDQAPGRPRFFRDGGQVGAGVSVRYADRGSCRGEKIMKLEINDKELKHGVLGLVLAIVEVIRDTLKIQSVKRMEGGSLTEEQIERLGNALLELDKAIDQIKEEQGVSEAVRSVRDGLDDLVDQMIHMEA